MRTPTEVETLLESAFQRIQDERMAGVPILNDRIQVEAVGFEEYGDLILGVLVTPWFMNVMLLPMVTDAWQGQVSGEKSVFELPGGSFEFIAGFEDGVGEYRMCSLFSPVFEFADHDSAVETARAVVDGVLRPVADTPDEARAKTPPRISRRDLFRSLAGAE